MGSIEQSIPIKNWKKNAAIQRLIGSHMFKEAKVVNVKLNVRRESGKIKKFAEIVYKLGGELYRAELKLRDDRHWDTRRRDVKRKKERTKGSHFTASDLLGQEGVS